MTRALHQYERWLASRIDGASLAAFRLLFGCFLVLDAQFFLARQDFYFPAQALYFHFPFFISWPHFDPATNTLLLIILGTMGGLIALGIATRFASAIAALLIAHMLLMDATVYMNHLVLTFLLASLLAFLPTDRYFALRRSQSRAGDRTIARYELFAVIALFWFSYVLGGVEKVRPEWFTGDIIAANMGLKRTSSEFAQWFYSRELLPLEVWSVLAIEFLAPLGLIYKKTRGLTILALVAFHIVNHFTMNIGLFSVLMLGSMVLYVEPQRFHWAKKGAASRRRSGGG